MLTINFKELNEKIKGKDLMIETDGNTLFLHNPLAAYKTGTKPVFLASNSSNFNMLVRLFDEKGERLELYKVEALQRAIDLCRDAKMQDIKIQNQRLFISDGKLFLSPSDANYPLPDLWFNVKVIHKNFAFTKIELFDDKIKFIKDGEEIIIATKIDN